MTGFGCRVLAYDPYPSDEAIHAGAEYVPLEELLTKSHIVTLHCPLTAETFHLINDEHIGQLHDGVMLVNVSRGALVETAAIVRGLKSIAPGAAMVPGRVVGGPARAGPPTTVCTN